MHGSGPSIESRLKRLNKKAVSFYGAVSVILIPSIREYREANLFHRLWWSRKDFECFENELVHAIRKCMEKTMCTDYRTAMQILACMGDTQGEDDGFLLRNTKQLATVPVSYPIVGPST